MIWSKNMKSTNMQRIVWLIVATASFLCVDCCVGFGVPCALPMPPIAVRHLQLALTASSQFQIILSITSNELQFEALQVIELVLSSFILEEQSYQTTSLVQSELTAEQTLVTPEAITDMEIVIQESEFQKELFATRIKFFALATFVATDSSVASEAKEYRQTFLNDLIEHSFSTDTKISQFVSNLRAASSSEFSTATALQFQDIDTIVIAPVAPASEPSSSTNDSNMDGESNDKDSGSSLSILDKVIIAISCGICGGLFVLLIWHFREVGHYIAATRHQLFLQNDNTMGSFPQMPRCEDDERSDGESSTSGSPHFVTTSFMSDENPDGTAAVRKMGSSRNESAAVFSSAPSHDATMVTPPSDFPILAMDGPESESHDELSTASFDTNVFQSATKIAPLGIRRNDISNHEFSQDVMQVDHEAEEMRSPATMDESSQTSVRSSNNRIGAVPVAYFLPIDPEDGSAADESVQRSSDDSSQVDDGDDFSLPQFTAVDVSSIGHLSLEQSMASSTPPNS